MPRCSERISVSLRMKTLNVNGSGDAYQSCSSDQPMQVAASILAAIPAGLRLPRSASWTSSRTSTPGSVTLIQPFSR